MLILADYMIIFVSLWVGVLFVILGANILYKFYLWIIIGFLLFLVFNSQIDVLENLYIRELSPFQNFLVENKGFILWLNIVFIPLLGLLSAMNQSISFHGKNNILVLLTLGMFLPFALTAILSYIWESLYVPLRFIEDILSFFQGGFFYEFFKEHLSWIIIGLLFFIFYKAIFLLTLAFLQYMYEVLRTEFFWAKEEDDPDEDIDQ